jgi:TolB-like protein/DNA-binding SARP family transcriptional activator
MIRFRMLGTVDLRDAQGRELPPVLRRPKLLALLAYLAIARPSGFHRRDTLVALLWPELDHAHARNALRQALHALREALGRDVFLTRGEDELALNEDVLWCDVREFEKALAAGDAERALELHRGELLRGLRLPGVRDFDRWLDEEQEHVRQRACEAARLLIDRDDAADNATSAARWARRLTELSPSDEKAVRRLIGILDRAGDRAGAVRAYEEFGRRLARDLELEPSSKTQGLIHSIRSRRQPERSAAIAPADVATVGESVTYAPPATSLSLTTSRVPPASPRHTRESGAEQNVRMTSPPRESSAFPSIVVLPFANLSPDADTDYFSDGLTEEVITDLSQVSALRVISRTSAMKLKGFKEDVRTIGRQLNVRYVLGGSVRRAGSNLRITAQLVDAFEDAHLWAEKFSGTVEDVFDIQEKVSRAIVSALRLKLAPEEERRIAARPIADVHAYECYLRARQEIWRASAGGLERALNLVRNGLAIVGENALLYAVMGQVHWQRAHTGVAPGGGHLAEAERALEKVFAVDTGSVHGHTLSAAIQYKKGRLQDVVRDSKRALASEPNNAEALFWLTVMYAHAGRASAARTVGEQLLHVDPLNAANYWARGWVEFTDGNFAEALRFSRRGCELDPDNFVCRCGHVVHLAGAGHTTEACREIDALPHMPEQPWSRAFIRYKAALQGNREEVLRDAAPDALSFAWDDEYVSWQMADTFAHTEEYDEALRWLEHATLERGFINYPFLSGRDPFLQGLHADPRFGTLMEQVKRKWEAFEL